MTRLTENLKIGRVTISSRIAMAPLTRNRGNDDATPGPYAKEYYSQRASVPGTLLVTEGTLICPAAGGQPNIPGIWTPAQVAGWRNVTAGVHEKGSFIFCQLWHLGRAGSTETWTKRLESSSAVRMSDESEVPEAMHDADIRQRIEDFAQAARNAIDAGFDGVEIHAANGYLIDQFTQDNCNQRTDAWGGSVENRVRFAVEVAKAVCEAVGADRTAIRLSPYSTFQGMLMKDPDPTFGYLLEQLRPLGLAYVHLVEARISGNVDVETEHSVKWLVEKWNNASPVLLAGGLDAEKAVEWVDERYKGYDVVAVFGRYFLANPDLVFRVLHGVPFQPYDRDTFYTPKKPEGYVDYPFSKEYLARTGVASKA